MRNDDLLYYALVYRIAYIQTALELEAQRIKEGESR